MNKIYNPKRTDWPEILRRPTQTVADIEDTVAAIFKEVKQKGDATLKKYTEKFDGVVINDLKVPEKEIENAIRQVSEDLKEAIQQAKSNIES
ncbi:MAG: histidinol dehydrogenase, partial [Pricia sp.]|nr:histidinol dehydrogenase [Pricia sp.]